MKAIIMAGGEGTRLRPLTCDCPKPMLKIMGRPMMEYALRLIKRCGIKEAAVTLGYLPQAVMDYFEDGAAFALDIRYYVEKSPLGTAGSVRMAKDFLDERFIVLSGDGICDFELEKAVEFHMQRRAQATMLLKKCPTPQEYGMVVLNADSTVRSFHEKPGRCDICSDLINTGIYILEPELLERIPEGAACDFGRDFFPALLADGIAVHGCVSGGYWCDVGDVAAYLQVHRDAMDGRIGVISAGDCAVSPDAVIEPGVQVELPCCISAGVHICSGASIGAYSWIGSGAQIRSGASVKKSIVMENARVFDNAQLRGCVLGRNAAAEGGAQLFEESVAGTNARVGRGATLMPGTRLWPCKALPDGRRCEENIVWGALKEECFVAGCLQMEEPAQAARCARACAAVMQAREMIIGRGASGVADAMHRAAIAGAMAQGVQVYDAGVCSLPQLRHAQRLYKLQCAALVDESGLLPLGKGGVPPDEGTRRSILKMIERQDYSGAFSGITHPAKDAQGSGLSYIAETAALFCPDPLYAPKVLLACENAHVLYLAEAAFRRAGIQTSTEKNTEGDKLRVEISPDGEKAFVSGRDAEMDEIQRQMMCAWTLLELGESRLVLRINATRAIDELCARRNAHAVYVPGDDAAWAGAVMKKSQRQFDIQFDGTAAALGFISALTERGLTLSQWQRSLPAVYRSHRRVKMDAQQSGAALQRLFKNAADAQLGGGVRLGGEGGWAWLAPDELRPEMCVMAEAARHETADELCFFYADALQRMIDGADD